MRREMTANIVGMGIVLLLALAGVLKGCGDHHPTGPAGQGVALKIMGNPTAWQAKATGVSVTAEGLDAQGAPTGDRVEGSAAQPTFPLDVPLLLYSPPCRWRITIIMTLSRDPALRAATEVDVCQQNLVEMTISTFEAMFAPSGVNPLSAPASANAGEAVTVNCGPVALNAPDSATYPPAATLTEQGGASANGPIGASAGVSGAFPDPYPLESPVTQRVFTCVISDGRSPTQTFTATVARIVVTPTETTTTIPETTTTTFPAATTTTTTIPATTTTLPATTTTIPATTTTLPATTTTIPATTITTTTTTTTTLPSFMLTVTTAGTGTGTVSSNPAGIACPGTCSASYLTGTVVTLTATAGGAGDAFVGWTNGPCSGSASPTCDVTMNAGKMATAYFAGQCEVGNTNDDGTGSLRKILSGGGAKIWREISPVSMSCSLITFAPAPFVQGQTITLTSGELSVPARTVTIDGGAGVTVSGNNSSRIFYVNSGANVTIENLTITQGNEGNGGAIYNTGIMLLGSNTTVSNNTTSGNGEGGGIFNDYGTLTVNGIVSNNTASGDGGGICNYGGMLTVNGTVSNNTASGGGGIFSSYGTLTVNGTVSNNIVSGSGGGIINYYETLTVNGTVTGNVADNDNNGYGDGGGVYHVGGGTVNNATASTVYGNTDATNPGYQCHDYYDANVPTCVLP